MMETSYETFCAIWSRSSWFILTEVFRRVYVWGVMAYSPSKRVYLSWLMALSLVGDVLVNSKIYLMLWVSGKVLLG